jgi:hypothetical protein
VCVCVCIGVCVHRCVCAVREKRERDAKLQKTLRTWTHKHTSRAFDAWSGLVAQRKQTRERTMRHWVNQVCVCMATHDACMRPMHSQRRRGAI